MTTIADSVTSNRNRVNPVRLKNRVIHGALKATARTSNTDLDDGAGQKNRFQGAPPSALCASCLVEERGAVAESADRLDCAPAGMTAELSFFNARLPVKPLS
jgi:hypothetical protein